MIDEYPAIATNVYPVELDNGSGFLCEARTRDGRIYQHYFVSKDNYKIERLAEKMNDSNREIDMLSEYWTFYRIEYGSEYHESVGDFHLMTDDEIENGIKKGYW